MKQGTPPLTRTIEWHHTLLTGLCQCPLPPWTIRSRVCEWKTPRPGHSHPIEEWETLSLGWHLPRHVCPFLPTKCNQCSWSSGSFGGEQEEQVQVPGLSLLIHPYCYWIIRSLWPTDPAVPKGPRQLHQADTEGELIQAPPLGTVWDSPKRQLCIGPGNKHSLPIHSSLHLLHVTTCQHTACTASRSKALWENLDTVRVSQG